MTLVEFSDTFGEALFVNPEKVVTVAQLEADRTRVDFEGDHVIVRGAYSEVVEALEAGS